MAWKAPYRPNNQVTQSYNDGVVTVYAVTDSARPGYQPKAALVQPPKAVLRYEEQRLGIQRYTRQLLQMTDEEYSEYINLWEQKQAEAQRVAEDFYSSELSALDAEYVQKIPETLSDLKGQLVAIGQDSALGLAEGFESEAGTVRSAFVDTIQEALDAAKASMGIHSPSTVWRDEVGANMALGMGEGFLRQMEAMADTITSSIPTPTVETVNNAAAGMVNGLSTLGSLGGNFRIEIPVIIDGKEFYRYTLDDLRAVERSNPEVVTT